MHVVAAGRWDLARSVLDPWDRADRVDLAGQAGLGVQAGRVAPAGRAVQEGPEARAVQLGRARRDPAGRVVRDAQVRVDDGLWGKCSVSRRFAGMKPEAGSPHALVGALGNVLRRDTAGLDLTAGSPPVGKTPANVEEDR